MTTPPTPETPKTPETPIEPEKKAEPGKTLLSEEEKKPDGAPEKYEAFKLPEGYEIDEKINTELTSTFKELNLSQDGAQKLIDFYSKVSLEAAKAPYDLWQKTQDDWITAVKADTEIGHKLDDVKKTTSAALDTLKNPALKKEFQQAMDFTGAGNNPAFIKAFYKLALMVTEGTPVPGNKPSPFGQSSEAKPASAAKALYPNLA